MIFNGALWTGMDVKSGEPIISCMVDSSKEVNESRVNELQ